MLGRTIRRISCTIYKIFNPCLRKTTLYAIPKIYSKNKLKLGKEVHINDCVFINAVGGVHIGNYSILSHGVSIISTRNKIIGWECRDYNEDCHINEEIIIGNNVWICANVTICSGVRIAHNCVVAAGAVVSSDLKEENCLYGGVPAKFIKKLNKNYEFES